MSSLQYNRTFKNFVKSTEITVTKYILFEILFTKILNSDNNQYYKYQRERETKNVIVHK